MKDPLQTEKTPWEILGLQPEKLTKADITAGWLKAIKAQEVSPDKAKAARDAMLNPVEKAWHRMLAYDDTALERLAPGATRDASMLTLEQRNPTAKAWELRFKTEFPTNHTVAHCLGVLHHWWVVALENELSSASTSSGNGPLQMPPALLEAWRGTIAYWVMLLETPEFWQNGLGITGSEQEELKKKLKENLDNRLVNSSHTFKDHESVAAEYRELRTSLAVELESAPAIRKYLAKTQPGMVRAGQLGLKRLGQLDNLRQHAEKSCKSNPTDENANQVRRVLSPYLAIDILIRDNKWDLALDQIQTLPKVAQKSVEVCKLRVRALLLQGKHRAELGKFTEAVESWRNALGVKDLPDDLRKQIEDEIVSACHKRASELQDKQLAEAITVLELGLQLVPTETKLKETLAELLTRKAIDASNTEHQKINDARKAGPRATSAAIRNAIPIVRQSVADLTRAVELGSKRAPEQLEAVREFLESLQRGTAPWPPELAELMRSARQAAEGKEWVKAVELVRKALQFPGFKKDKQIRKSLAAALVNGAVSVVMGAMELVKLAQREGGDVAATVRSLHFLFNEAEKEILEALQLDPDSEYARTNLAKLGEILGQVRKIPGVPPRSLPLEIKRFWHVVKWAWMRSSYLAKGVPVLLVVIAAAIPFWPTIRDELGWRMVQTSPSLEAYRNYERVHPNGKHLSDARTVIEQFVWQGATNANTSESLEGYLEAYGTGRFASEARTRLEDSAWQSATNANTIKAFRSYAELYQQGRYVVEARSREAALRTDEQPLLAALEKWTASAAKEGTESASDDVGTRQLLLKRRHETESALQDFLNEFPGHDKEANIKVLAEGRDVFELLNEKVVEMETQSSGTQSITIQVRKLVPYLMTVRIPAGSLLVMTNTASPNMETTVEERVHLVANDWKSVILQAKPKR